MLRRFVHSLLGLPSLQSIPGSQQALGGSSAVLQTCSSSLDIQHQHPFGLGQALRYLESRAKEYAYDDEGQARNRIKFVSRERKLVPRPPFYRPPIYFPTVTLQMLKLTDEQKAQIKETGWTREVAFKTTPNVTKLEIKGILESMYGMEVERVHTANYLGRKYVTFTGTKRQLWRADDWKKAYVIFKAPAGMYVEPSQKHRPGMLEQLLTAKGLMKPEEEGQQQLA